MLEKSPELFRTIFGRAPAAVAFAPGRIEFIGNHTDYNGGPVIGAAIDRGVWVAIAPRTDGRWRLASDYPDAGLRVLDLPAGPPARHTGAERWANYPLGVLSVLPAFGLPVPSGFDYLAVSNVPAGAGLSSSAAIELASALAFLALGDRSCPPEVLAQIGRRAENEFVGVPCGLLDQGVSAFAEAGRLVWIDCRTQAFSRLPFLPGASLWVFNTHARHALVDGLYAQRHRECQEAARLLGVPLLADADAALLERGGAALPEPVRRRARHVVDEIARVHAVRDLLAAGDAPGVGRLLSRSHDSSRHLFENSAPELDFLVDVLLEMPDVHGARLTGGGFGGAVMALTGPGFTRGDADIVASLYEVRYQAAPEVFQFGCGPGAHRLASAGGGRPAGTPLPQEVRA